MAVALKILLVEDSAIDAELAAYELAKLGMAVEWKRVSTEKALRQALLEFCPSVILSDHSMPAFDGLSALHIASEMTPEIPFIFLSGTIGEEMAIEALKGGATDYVLKANLARLGPAVVRAVREASDKQARRRAEAARARLAAILEATPDFVGIYDAARMFTYINAGGRRLLRLGRDADLPVYSLCAHWCKELIEEGTAQASTSRTWLGEAALVDVHGVEIPVSVVLIAHNSEDEGIEFFSMIARDIRERKTYESQISYLANYDQLTGLPNRCLLNDRAAQAMAYARRERHEMALMLLSIDQLEVVNEGYGRMAAEQAVVEIAKRLGSVSRQGDTVARIGEDSFAVLATDIPRTETVFTRARALNAALRTSIRVLDTDVRMTVSVGMSVFPRDADDWERLVANAESAMSRARAEGQGNIRFYASGMERKALDRLDLASALERALSNGELTVHYQPQFSIRTRQIVGAEALLRWNRNGVGPVSPAAFIPVSEESELIVRIGQWVLENVCVEAAQWNSHSPCRVGVNVSARQLYSGIADHVRNALRASGLRPECLELELTESTALRDTNEAGRVLRELKSLGVAIAIDDFGTGQSGLSYLSRLPVDRLKIDKSFVHRMTKDKSDRAIVQTIISMSRILGLEVIAEGTETEEQCRALLEDGCQYAQGFLYSPAIKAEEFRRLHRESQIKKD
jgi:diguanylate cyclase (GGDEF)-like protein